MVPAVSNPDVFNPCLLLHMGPQGVPLTSTVTGCGCERYVLPGLAPPPPPVAAHACAAQPPSLAGYSTGSMAGAGIITGLVMCAIGFFFGQWMGRRKAAASHVKLVEMQTSSS